MKMHEAMHADMNAEHRPTICISLMSFSFLTNAAFNPMPSSAEPVKLQGSRILPCCLTLSDMIPIYASCVYMQYIIYNLYTH